MKKLKINEIKKLAEKHNGKCLSKEYINNRTKLKWQCKEGHVWYASLNIVKNQKSWCPYCAGRNLTIKDMQKIAESRGGKPLSKYYVNAHTKLKWQCDKGHIWEATPNNIKKGSWCPQCSLTFDQSKAIVRKKINKDKGWISFDKILDNEMMENKKHIDDLIKLSKHNPAIKKYLLKKIMDNFFGDLEEEFAEWFSSNDMLR